MKLACLVLALICIHGTSAALNMIRRDPMVTIADEGTTRYDWHPPTTTMDLRERTSIHWDDHHLNTDWHDDHWNDIVHVTESVNHWDDHHTTPIPHLDTTTHWWGNTHDDIVLVTESARHLDLKTEWHNDHWNDLVPVTESARHWDLKTEWHNDHWNDIVHVTESDRTNDHGDHFTETSGPDHPKPSQPLPGPTDVVYKCKFSSGDGNGGTEVKIGSQKGRECVRACVARKKEDDSINGVTVWQKKKKGGCWCEKKMTGIKKSGEYRTCFLEPIVKPQASDYSYNNYKNKECADKQWYAKGCYKTRRAFKRGKLLVYWRHEIEWARDRISSFASSLACACAEAARAQGVKFFGLHYWGECWALDIEDVVGDPDGDCKLTDGSYKKKCLGTFNKDWGHTCLGGTKSYFLHYVLDGTDRPDYPVGIF